MEHLRLGQRAETLVAAWLEARGFRILERNARMGRLEIDIIAQQGRTLVFCEVRARTHARFMNPEDSVTSAKIDRLQRAARLWLESHSESRGCVVRFDVASVVFDTTAGRVTYFDNAF
ncbi:MAG: YraN family protein [Myxococcales bacterium]|nr:YraN family protein [Myxococcales bacterium]MCB9708418.1 YraN family protein [Myxococcales bacterium]